MWLLVASAILVSGRPGLRSRRRLYGTAALGNSWTFVAHWPWLRAAFIRSVTRTGSRMHNRLPTALRCSINASVMDQDLRSLYCGPSPEIPIWSYRPEKDLGCLAAYDVKQEGPPRRGPCMNTTASDICCRPLRITNSSIWGFAKRIGLILPPDELHCCLNTDSLQGLLLHPKRPRRRVEKSEPDEEDCLEG